MGKKERRHSDVEANDEDMKVDESIMIEERELAQEILKTYIKDIATNLHAFSQNNLQQ